MFDKETLLLKRVKSELGIKSTENDRQLRMIISEYRQYHPIDMNSPVKSDEVQSILKLARLFF